MKRVYLPRPISSSSIYVRGHRNKTKQRTGPSDFHTWSNLDYLPIYSWFSLTLFDRGCRYYSCSSKMLVRDASAKKKNCYEWSSSVVLHVCVCASVHAYVAMVNAVGLKIKKKKLARSCSLNAWQGCNLISPRLKPGWVKVLSFHLHLSDGWCSFPPDQVTGISAPSTVSQ